MKTFTHEKEDEKKYTKGINTYIYMDDIRPGGVIPLGDNYDIQVINGRWYITRRT